MSPHLILFLPISSCFSPSQLASPHLNLLLPISTCFSPSQLASPHLNLLLPISTCFSPSQLASPHLNLFLPISTCFSPSHLVSPRLRSLFHRPWFYKHIHKQHHEWTAPIGLTSIYAHPIEHIFCNILPPVVGPLILGSHIATSCLWFSLALVSTSIAHCGYHFPFLPSPEAHDFHHSQ